MFLLRNYTIDAKLTFPYQIRMEYGGHFTVFGQKMTVKSGPEKNIFEIFPCSKPIWAQ